MSLDEFLQNDSVVRLFLLNQQNIFELQEGLLFVHDPSVSKQSGVYNIDKDSMYRITNLQELKLVLPDIADKQILKLMKYDLNYPRA